MPTSAKVICDSLANGVRLCTMVLEYPRIIHSEFMTHRMFSRNASSSRAIPVEKQIERVATDGFYPVYLGKNQKGMQAIQELDEQGRKDSLLAWHHALINATYAAKNLAGLGVHKQLANRVLEPFSHIQVVVTATQWDNFYLQRLDKNAQPEIQELARVMKEAMNNSTPKLLKVGEWHLPFVNETDEEIDNGASDFYYNRGVLVDRDFLDVRKKVSVARCARVSYGLNERGWGDIEKDLALYDMLLTNNHWSPFEHQATPMQGSNVLTFSHYVDSSGFQDVQENLFDEKGITHIDRNLDYWSGNFRGWVQNRQLIQQSN